MYWRLPDTIAAKIERGELEPSEVLVASLIEPAGYGNPATVATLRQLSKLSRRAVQYALYGRGSRAGLRPYLEYTREHGWTWRRFRRWVRIGWKEIAALVAGITREALQAAAWTWRRVQGTETGRLPFEPDALATMAGWTRSVARRAMLGGSNRRGAAGAGLVELVDGELVDRYAQDLDQAEPQEDLDQAEPQEDLDQAAGDSAAWVHLFRLAARALGRDPDVLTGPCRSHVAHPPHADSRARTDQIPLYRR